MIWYKAGTGNESGKAANVQRKTLKVIQKASRTIASEHFEHF